MAHKLALQSWGLFKACLLLFVSLARTARANDPAWIWSRGEQRGGAIRKSVASRVEQVLGPGGGGELSALLCKNYVRVLHIP